MSLLYVRNDRRVGPIAALTLAIAAALVWNSSGPSGINRG